MNLMRIAALCLVVLCVISCADNRFEVDISTVDYTAKFHRLDQEVFSEDVVSSSELAEVYGDFLGIYFREIMQMPSPDNPMLSEFLQRFTSDPTWQNLQEDIEKKYSNLSAQELILENALKSYSVHFDDLQLPQLVVFNSGFNVGIYPSNEWLGVGLEWYLSPQNRVVQKLPPDLFPLYKREKMKPEYLAVNALKGFLFFKHQNKLGDDLLASMVFRGKMLFITKALMEVSDADLLNYSTEQLLWVVENEYAVWTYIIENDLVFSKDQKQIAKLINDGPFTPGMPPESPGGIGTWIGLQMVEAFMNEFKSYTLKDLLAASDRQILEQYKPGR